MNLSFISSVHDPWLFQEFPNIGKLKDKSITCSCLKIKCIYRHKFIRSAALLIPKLETFRCFIIYVFFDLLLLYKVSNVEFKIITNEYNVQQSLLHMNTNFFFFIMDTYWSTSDHEEQIVLVALQHIMSYVPSRWGYNCKAL